MKNYASEIATFYNYCIQLYDIKIGKYPIATEERILQAANHYLESKPLSQIYFDIFDREEVGWFIIRSEILANTQK